MVQKHLRLKFNGRLCNYIIRSVDTLKTLTLTLRAELSTDQHLDNSGELDQMVEETTGQKPGKPKCVARVY